MNKLLNHLSRQDGWHFYLLIGLVTFISFLVNGYQYSSSDLSLYLSYLPVYEGRHVYHPADLILLAKQAGGHYYSFGLFPVLLLKKFISVPWACLIIHLTCQYLIYFTFFKFVECVFDRKVAWMALGLLAFKKMVAGAPVGTLEDVFSVRSIALPMLFWSLREFMKKRYLAAFFWAGIAGNFHLLSAGSLLMIMSLALVWEIGFSQWKKWLSCGVVSVLCMSPVLIWRMIVSSQNHGNGLPLFPGPGWFRIVHLRAAYLFPMSWDLNSWLYLVSIGVAFVGMVYYSRKQLFSKPLYQLTVTSLVLALVFSLLSQFNFPPAISFQLVRSWLFLVYFIFVFIAWLAVRTLETESSQRWFLWTYLFYWVPLYRWGIIFSGLPLTLGLRGHKQNNLSSQTHNKIKRLGLGLILVMLGLLSILGYKKIQGRWHEIPRKMAEHIDIYGIKGGDDWIALQRWFRYNTSPEIMVITPPDMTGFRKESQRSTFVENKDGAMSVYSERYAREWEKRMSDLRLSLAQETHHYANQFDSLKEPVFIDISRQYGAYYLVTRRFSILKFPVVYENSKYRVYYLND